MTTAIIPDRLKLLDTIRLDHGPHDSWEDGHCAMETVAWLAGEDHTDRPACVCPVLGAFVRRWNDDLPDDESRERLLRPVLPRLVGTAGDGAVSERRAWMAADWLVREHTPAWLDLAPALAGHAGVMRALPPISDRATAEASAAAWAAAWATASAPAAVSVAASVAAGDAAGAAAWEAAGAVASAVTSAVASAGTGAVALEAAGAAASAVAWEVAWAVAGEVAGEAAWEAASAVAWEVAGEAASAVASEAAQEVAGEAALAPTVAALQTSALGLLDRMIEARA